MKTIKQARIGNIKDWMTKFMKIGAGMYHLSVDKLGFNAVDQIDTLTAKQLKLVNALIVSAYHTGCNDTRQWYADCKAQQARINNLSEAKIDTVA